MHMRWQHPSSRAGKHEAEISPSASMRWKGGNDDHSALKVMREQAMSDTRQLWRGEPTEKEGARCRRISLNLEVCAL